jgi:polar amino acid transport system substrate-binding protein
MRTPSRLLAVLAGAALAVALTACSDSSTTDPTEDPTDTGTEAAIQLVNPGQLTVCSDMPYPPFEMVENGVAVGFDIDVASEIAEDLGLQLNVLTTGFDAIESGAALDAGECDMAASAIGMEEERLAKMSFSNPYYETFMGVMVGIDSDLNTLEDLSQVDIGVQMGTTGETWARSEPLIAGNIRQFETLGDQMTALLAGEVEAIINDTPALVYYGGTEDYRVIVGLNTAPEAPMGLAFKLGNTALVDAANATLARIQSDGTMDQILAKWGLNV